jgi:large subunit ribosomal protein L13
MTTSKIVKQTKSLAKEDINKNWLIVDAENIVLGRLASAVSKILRGKHKPSYTPHADCGDNVVIVNAEKVKLTGNKLEDKVYYRHTGYPGGQRSLTAKELFAKDPARLIEKSVKGMLPKNKLGAALFRNLKVYVGENHKHEGQSPVLINLNDLK